jgi:protein kinase
MHDMGIFHRDLKPENLLWSEDNVLKICDFGLSKAHDKFNMPHTSYVSTRWYRAPEIMLKIDSYDPKVDIFALGCIMAELYTG